MSKQKKAKKVSKRYVFWRDASGRPSKEEKWAPKEILAGIGKSATLNDEGKPQWTDFFWWDEGFTAVRSKVVILDKHGEEINDHNTWSIVRRAISAVVKKDGGGKSIKLSRLIWKVNELAEKFFSVPLSKYFFVSSMSINHFPFKSAKIGQCRFIPIKSRRRYPYPNLVQAIDSQSPIGQHIYKNSYKLFRVETSARTNFEAVSTALTATYHLRALWSLFATLGKTSNRSGSWKIKPIGVVHSGPIHTLHQPDGTPDEDYYWFEPYYVSDQKLFDAKGKWETIEQNRRWAMRRIDRLPYGPDLKLLLERYIQALDSPNLEVAFLHMWGLLEKITGTTGGSYDETIKRVVRPLPDREIAIELIEAVRCRRNQYVHSARSGGDSDQIAYLVKSFVDTHLIRLIMNDFKVGSLEEYGQVLSMPSDANALKERCDKSAKELKWARKIIKYEQMISNG